MRHRAEFILFQLVRGIVLALPLGAARGLGAALGRAAYGIARSRRAVALDNLARAFPEKSSAERRLIARGAFRNYGIALFEFLWFPNLTDDRLKRILRVGNPGLLTEAHGRGKGVVVLSGHFGNWELAALGVARLTGLPITIIVQTQSNRLVDAVINRYRCLFGNRVVPMGISVREIIRTLGGGGIVAIAPDQSAAVESVFVEFFGRRVSTHQGPAQFALREGSPMLIGSMTRSRDGSYDVVLEEILTSDLRDPTPENVEELTKRHTAALERRIREHPDHWLWMHRRWKHTLEPAGVSAGAPPG